MNLTTKNACSRAKSTSALYVTLIGSQSTSSDKYLDTVAGRNELRLVAVTRPGFLVAFLALILPSDRLLSLWLSLVPLFARIHSLLQPSPFDAALIRPPCPSSNQHTPSRKEGVSISMAS